MSGVEYSIPTRVVRGQYLVRAADTYDYYASVVSVFDGRGWSQPDPVFSDNDGSGVPTASCATATFCVAGDAALGPDADALSVYDKGGWSPPKMSS
jgi:hypothetical protein